METVHADDSRPLTKEPFPIHGFLFASIRVSFKISIRSPGWVQPMQGVASLRHILYCQARSGKMAEDQIQIECRMDADQLMRGRHQMFIEVGSVSGITPM